MDATAYGWLSNCAFAPAIGALTVWILFMFNIYRSEWRNVDIFLVLITIQQLLSCSSIFAYSLVNIIRSRVETSCNLTVWSLTTLRIFQLSTIGSLAMDRALTLKWPYKYRFSVRSNQICYHIVVIALMSGLVGVAGVFARVSPIFQQSSSVTYSSSSSSPLSSTVSIASTTPIPTTSPLSNYPKILTTTTTTMPINYTQSSSTLIIPINSLMNQQVCSLNPLAWDIRFNLFFTCLCGLITLITLSSFVYIECNRDTNDSSRSTPKSKMLPNSRISSFGDLAVENLGSNEAITTNNTNTNKYNNHSPGSLGGNGGNGNGGVGVGVGVGVGINPGNGITSGSHNSLQRFYSISKEDSRLHPSSNHHHHQQQQHLHNHSKLHSNHSFNKHHNYPQHHPHPHHGNNNILNHIRSSDMRWAVVVAITSLSYAVNQGPSLIFMFIGMIVPNFWTPLHDNVITWFALIEGFLLPISLYLTDDNFRDAVKLSFRRSSGSSGCLTSSGGGGLAINPSSSSWSEKYAKSGLINSKSHQGFAFHYNDFVLIDKPYLGLMKSPEAKRSPSTLNLVTSSTSRSPYPGRHNQSSTDNRSQSQLHLNSIVGGVNRHNHGSSLSINAVGAAITKSSSSIGLFANHHHYHQPHHLKGQLSRKTSHLSSSNNYITELSKKQTQSGLTLFNQYLTNNSTINSQLTRSDDSIKKEKIPSLARISPMTWSVNGDNWHFSSSSTVDRKMMASTMELTTPIGGGQQDNQDDTLIINDDNDKGRLIGKSKKSDGKRKSNEVKDFNKKEKQLNNLINHSNRFNNQDDDDIIDDDEHIYATLKVRSVGDSNSDYGRCKDAIKSSSQQPQLRKPENSVNFDDDASISQLSFTTNANDDFEFHDTRESGSAIYTKSDNLGNCPANGKQLGDVESGESTSSGEDVSIITSDSCSTSDSESDNQPTTSNQKSQLNQKSSVNYMSHQQLYPSRGNHYHLQPNRHHYSSQLALTPNHLHLNHLQMEKGKFYVSKTANLIAANPILGGLINRNKSRSSSQIVNPNNILNGNNQLGGGIGEEKRRGWQFFSASDLHLLDTNNGQSVNQLPTSSTSVIKENLPSSKQQDSHFINPLSNHYYYNGKDKLASGQVTGPSKGVIGSRRSMSETNLSPGRTISQFIQQQQQSIYGSRDAGLYHLNRSTHDRIHLPFDPNYPAHINHNQQHDTNSSDSTNSSGSSFGPGDRVNRKRFANLITGGEASDRRLERISSFSKNRPRIRAQKYQLNRRAAATAAKRQESIKELSVDYRRNCVGSRLSLTQQDLISGPSEQLGAFVSVKSMPDLTINSYLPIYNQLSSINKH